MTPAKDRRHVQSVVHSVKILEELQQPGGVTLSEIAEAVGLAPGTTHTHLETLRAHNFVVKRDGEFFLSPQLITLGERARSQEPIYEAGKKAIQDLASETGEAAHLIREIDGRVLPVYEVFGERAIGVDYHVEKRERLVRHLHCTASGKALLSKLPPEYVEEVLETQGLVTKTPNTIDDREALFEELERVEERGFAIADEEQMLGIRAVGAPIMRIDGSVAGAISVSGPKSRLHGAYLRDELPELVLEAVNVTEINLNRDDSSVADSL
ncbi:DNA-binding transcriptional regulator, IclR family [Halanaeroarchaeum sp. HSR-CO]|uniref:IclR family transcriptional regulator n=1 Tax=Halanaeroarchaeum sp. HSR-CO TaxID=2866382 RepID=UPI00217CC319|nr:IclR family transcriptional regulator [Halanaeroarchaeum sp. HSR-CO]UWG47098.1 DNA-binding transcriptional regulator, IclR family [Halanaeroarchaeum sp. HSR-CO]